MVISPIRVRNEAGGLDAVELGSYPEGSLARQRGCAQRGARGLTTAAAALWPTMSVAERIGCMQVLVTEMKARRGGERRDADGRDADQYPVLCRLRLGQFDLPQPAIARESLRR